MAILWQVSNFWNRMTVHERILISSTWLFFFSLHMQLKLWKCQVDRQLLKIQISTKVSYDISVLLKSLLLYVPSGKSALSYSLAREIGESSIWIFLEIFFSLSISAFVSKVWIMVKFLCRSVMFSGFPRRQVMCQGQLIYECKDGHYSVWGTGEARL